MSMYWTGQLCAAANARSVRTDVFSAMNVDVDFGVEVLSRLHLVASDGATRFVFDYLAVCCALVSVFHNKRDEFS